ncbi:helix-turn-helix domain-containing protein [Sphingobium boeckii]|uniref:DNA-binding IclR family transcriptional regulator n=1 Tax=Sphingobium boeckii TaxID=1082345 RepID=A0A7W9AJD0_9SPHN|nr:helix-turn-helix domain-containing protein [Sphingobium boeckii]MBB5686740.1 DNA-binding IclR family transcriptional regulator [Sphingobium boeckii]
MALVESNKAKIAKRVIEVLEFFDEEHPQATVMDIVRRFDRPQSSTSELLSSLVDLGLLHKDPCSRSYSPTPRAAMLGCAVQPGLVRDGRLTDLIDRLSAQTGLGVAVFGMVGLKIQVFNWRSGKRTFRTSGLSGFCGGQQEHLSDSAAGMLLLSTVAQPRRDGMIRRLNAEAATERKFSFTDMAARVQQCRDGGNVSGAVGFGSIADVTAVLLPDLPENQPLAIGFVYEPSEHIDTAILMHTLNEAVGRCIEGHTSAPDTVQPLFDAAWRPRLEKMHG